jgi:chromosome segregation ATPase
MISVERQYQNDIDELRKQLADAESLAADYRDRLCTAEASAARSLSRAESSERYAAERRESLQKQERRAEKAERENERLLIVLMQSPPRLTADEIESMLFIRDEIERESRPLRRVDPVRKRLIKAIDVLDKVLGSNAPTAPDLSELGKAKP